MSIKRNVLTMLAVLLAIIMLSFVAQKAMGGAQVSGATRACDSIGGQNVGFNKLGKKDYWAWSTMTFCWGTSGKNLGRIVSWTVPSYGYGVTTWGDAFGWTTDGLIAAGGPKCVGRDAKGRCLVAKAKRVFMFHQCVPVPTGCLRHAHDKEPIRFQIYGSGNSLVSGT